MKQFILAIDQGTTGSTVSIMDQSGQVIAKADQDFPQIFPQPGWVEHDPEHIWQSVLKSLQNVIDQSQIPTSAIGAIGVTNQRETVVAWDRQTGRPIGNAIVWQCRRTTEDCKKLKKYEKMIRQKTGLVLDPYFSATKMAWILKNRPEAGALAKKNQLCFGTIDAFIVWKLTAGKVFKTDHSNASRTMLYNLHQQGYDPQLLQVFRLKAEMLPEIEDSNGDFGVTRSVPGLCDGIPIRGVVGDQQAALFGQIGLAPGDAKITFGTGSFLLFNTGNKIISSKKGMLTTVGWKLKKQKLIYALEGGAFVCGAAVQWLRDGLGFFENSSDVENLARSVEDAGGVEFVPALTGLGAPYWKPEARGTITGLTRGTGRSHIARATLEAMALQNVDILTAMTSDAKIKIKSVRVDGGATANNLLMQLQSDYLGLSVHLPQNIETTSVGAALMAGLGVGLWPDLRALAQINPVQKTFQSQLKNKERKLRIEKWHRAVNKAF